MFLRRAIQLGILAGLHPSLDLDFTTGVADPRITFSGGAGGTRIDSTGTLVSASAPRFDYDPVTLTAKGLLVEEQRTNLLLNSKLDGTNLATQSVTVTAQAYTLSFYGTGTVTLSGTATGAKVGTGSFPTQSQFTFTPTAGTLTLTVSGTVQFSNLEAGSFATSFIPTAGAAVTRTADSAVMTGANFSSWFNPAGGTFVIEGATSFVAGATAFPNLLSVDDGTANNRIIVVLTGATSVFSAQIITGAVSQANIALLGSAASGQSHKFALMFAANDVQAAQDGTLGTQDTAVALPVVDRLQFGKPNYGLASPNDRIKRLRFYPQRLADPIGQRFTQ